MKHRHLQVAAAWARLLDNTFTFGRFKFGIEPIINAVPVLGPIITFGLSLYLFWIARDLRVPSDIMATMLRNIVLDAVLGAIPVVGTIGDFFFKANMRNLKLLEEWAESKPIEGKIIASHRVSPSA